MTARAPTPLLRDLRSTLEKMEVALCAIPDAIVWTDCDGVAEWSNTAFDSLIGRSHDRIIGSDLVDLLPVEQNGQVVPRDGHPVGLILKGHQEWAGCYELPQGDGRLTLEITASAVHVGENQRSAVLAIRDVTYRSQVEDVLHREATFVKLLQEVAAAANEARSIEEALQAAVDLVSKRTEWPVGHVYLPTAGEGTELIPTTIWHLADPSRFAEFREATEAMRFRPGVDLPGRVYETAEPVWVRDVTHDVDFARADLAAAAGLRAGFGFPVRLGAEVAAVFEFFAPQAVEPDDRLLEIVSHIGTQLGRVIERTRAEEELRRFASKLELSNRELQDFAYVASHDLQEPLRKIQAFGDRLRTRCAEALTDQGRDYLDRMQGAARRMSALITDLLTFSRVNTRGEPFVPVSLAEVALEVLTDLEVRIEQSSGSIQLGELPTIEADPSQMRQLLQNLIGNALKFHRPEVPPVVSVSCHKIPTAGTPMAALSAEAYEILVEDNGIGFDERYLDRIFNVFQRLHGRYEYEGTGIGLALCRRIAERHNGSITARSTPGEGSTFIVTLPAHQPRTERAE